MSHANYLTTQDVANVFGVDTKTIQNWGKTRKLLPAAYTPGGHRRYDVVTVVDLAKGLGWSVPADLEARAVAARGEVVTPGAA